MATSSRNATDTGKPTESESGVPGRLRQRLRDYAALARLERPIGALLLLWPTLWGLWIAGAGQPSARLVVIFVAGTFLMRSAGCAINDYADRDFDRHVKRTGDRPLTSGRISSTEAIGVFAVFALAAFALVLMTNRLTVLLSLAGLVIAMIYPFLKRFTHLPQLWLGVAFSWGIPMAFAAETGAVPALAWLLLAANLFWVLAYDTIYAMVDRDDDIAVGIRSTAILFGKFDWIVVFASQMIALVLLCFVWAKLGLSLWFFVGWACALAFALYELALYIGRQRERCFQAFVNNNWFGVSIFCGIVLGFLPSQ